MNTTDSLFDVSGKVAVITGAGGVLCSEIARSLAARGVRVALLGRTLSKVQALFRRQQQEATTNSNNAVEEHELKIEEKR